MTVVRRRERWAEIEVKSAAFRFFWLRHVRAFDPTQHCSRALVGEWSGLVPFIPRKEGLRVNKAPAAMPGFSFLYLCGVTDQWANNIHVAMRAAPGKRSAFEDANVRCAFDGYEQLPIPALPPEVAGALDKSYATCRNYQFAWWYLPLDRTRQMALFESEGKQLFLKDWNGRLLGPLPREVMSVRAEARAVAQAAGRLNPIDPAW